MLNIFCQQVRKVRKVLKPDDLIKMDTEIREAPEGVLNQRDLGSRQAKKRTETAAKEEPTDMEIDLELDDLAARE